MILKEKKAYWEQFKGFLQERELLEEYLHLLRHQYGAGFGELKMKHVWSFEPSEYCKKIPWVLTKNSRKWIDVHKEWRELIEKGKDEQHETTDKN